jgi:hypothetical protein
VARVYNDSVSDIWYRLRVPTPDLDPTLMYILSVSDTSDNYMSPITNGVELRRPLWDFRVL